MKEDGQTCSRRIAEKRELLKPDGSFGTFFIREDNGWEIQHHDGLPHDDIFAFGDRF